jgi:hypothetical protein
VVPYGATWVSSQLVIENTGVLGTDPSAAFGIWTAEPYTRSRSVAQMAILTVSNDPSVTATTSQDVDDVSCAAFADQTTEECSVLDMNGRTTWRLISANGATLVWFDGLRRYELFARNFVADGAVLSMASDLVPLEELAPFSP